MNNYPPRIRPRRYPLIVTLLAAAAAIALASPGLSASASASTPSPGAVWARWVQCAHRHGYPTLRDPAIGADGSANFGSQNYLAKQALLQLTACKSILAKLPPSWQHPAPTPAQLHNLVQFSECMRRYGLPDWPDPHPDGTFPLPQRIIALGKRGIAHQLQACSKYYSGGIGVSRG